jgi:predicted dehydrogenase
VAPKARIGGGPLPDVGIYCINAARFLSSEEPVEVIGDICSTLHDPGVTEVEESAHFILRFQSGLKAICYSSFANYRSHFFLLLGSIGWAEMDPAYVYQGLRLGVAHQVDGREAIEEPQIDPANQFALEINHMSCCVRRNVPPHTSGEEGMQHQCIIEALYGSAWSARPVSLHLPAQTRGADAELSRPEYVTHCRANKYESDNCLPSRSANEKN